MNSSRHLPVRINSSAIDADIRQYQLATMQTFKEVLVWIQYLISEYMNNIDRIFLGGAQDKFSILTNHVNKLGTCVSDASTIFPSVEKPDPAPTPTKGKRPHKVFDIAPQAEEQFPFGAMAGGGGIGTINAMMFQNVSIEMLLNDSPIDPDANAFAYSYDRSMVRCLMVGVLTGRVVVRKPDGTDYNYRSGYFVPVYPGFGYTKYLDEDTNNANFAERKGWNTWTDFKNICIDNRDKYPLTGIPQYIPNAANPIWCACGIDKTPFVPMHPEIVDQVPITTDDNKQITLDKAATIHYVGYKLIWHVPYFKYVFDTSKELLENINWAITNIGSTATPEKDYERWDFYQKFKTSTGIFVEYTNTLYQILKDIKSIGDQLESPLGQSLLGSSNGNVVQSTRVTKQLRNSFKTSRRSRRLTGIFKPISNL